MIIVVTIKPSFTVSLGEALGWRGHLVPRWESFGPQRTVLLSDILHGI